MTVKEAEIVIKEQKAEIDRLKAIIASAQATIEDLIKGEGVTTGAK